METLARFRAPEDAHLLRAFLSSREIPSVIFDEHVIQLFWNYSDAFGGARLMVHESYMPEAVEALAEYRKALAAEPVLQTEARAWPVVLLLYFTLGIPLLLFGRRTTRWTGSDVSGTQE